MKKCLAVLLSLLLFSCEQDEKFLVDSNCIVQDSHFVDIAYAEAIASIGDGFYLPKSEELISKSTDDHEVESVISLDDIFGTPALYIINLRGGGFRIISADNRLEPILAHSDTGRMTEESINKNGGIANVDKWDYFFSYRDATNSRTTDGRCESFMGKFKSS